MQKAALITDIFLDPGAYFVGEGLFRIRTLLGSCVSITLWHPARRIGAMSHFLLARRGGAPAARHAEGGPDARYGEDALGLMIDEIAAAGVAPTECQAKIFGGGNMFPDFGRRAHALVGTQNGVAAKEWLREHRIAVVSENLYGTGHRQVIFEVETGDVWVRQASLGDMTVARHHSKEMHGKH
ncbi:MAG: chemotaxis protein CheD [Pseudomonadota bacterium]